MSVFGSGPHNGNPIPKDPSAYYFRRRRDRNPYSVLTGRQPEFERIVDPENLIAVFYERKAKGGQAAGPDRVRYEHLSRGQVGDICRELSTIVREQAYRPGGCRIVSIPKLMGGTRDLRLRSIVDRVLSSAVQKGLERYWEAVFLPCSMGFRPHRGVWRMLAEMAHRMEAENRWVLAVDDVRKAFDNINIDDVMDDHRDHLQDTKLLWLIECILRGDEGQGRTVGIDQGSPYSPTAMNVRLHHALDLELDRDPMNPPGYRYADNLVYLCRDVSEGCEVLDRVQAFLQSAGLTLKGDDGPPADLKAGEEAQVLGFGISRRNEQVHLDLGEQAWRKLEQNLTEAHKADNPPESALSCVRSWIAAYGPAFESLRAHTVRQVLGTASDYGFREILPPQSVWSVWQDAWNGWLKFREKVRRTLTRSMALGPAAPPALTAPVVRCGRSRPGCPADLDTLALSHETHLRSATLQAGGV